MTRIIFISECTFIVLDRRKFDETQDEIEAMIGDTNIFLKNDEDVEIGEIEVMIAEKNARGKGMGKETVLMMLRYGSLEKKWHINLFFNFIHIFSILGIENLQIKTYQAKILMDNHQSIAMFQNLGFEKIGESTIFKEFTFEKQVNDEWIDWIIMRTKNYNVKEELIT